MDGLDLTDAERGHLRRCVELAGQALAAGDEPFGSVLVDADGSRLVEERNQVLSTADPTRHPEFALARWAAEHLSEEDRTQATVYTSGEHCPMCAAAHGWVGLGRIVYVHSAQQHAGWLADLGLPTGPVRPIPAGDVAPGVPVDGPVPELAEQMHRLHLQFHQQPPAQGASAPGPGASPG
ncbi:nucleoside deaminase [Aquipuribacter hungaricus]|uniref:Nucleoside deaminase n=1 Tax=Aquipuribacter hungaricus TaxID=545624 RepID=A0ABV7WK31_9MICO